MRSELSAVNNNSHIYSGVSLNLLAWCSGGKKLTSEGEFGPYRESEWASYMQWWIATSNPVILYIYSQPVNTHRFDPHVCMQDPVAAAFQLPCYYGMECSLRLRHLVVWYVIKVASCKLHNQIMFMLYPLFVFILSANAITLHFFLYIMQICRNSTYNDEIFHYFGA